MIKRSAEDEGFHNEYLVWGGSGRGQWADIINEWVCLTPAPDPSKSQWNFILFYRMGFSEATPSIFSTVSMCQHANIWLTC